MRIGPASKRLRKPPEGYFLIVAELVAHKQID
jgi:hypothetical protein